MIGQCTGSGGGANGPEAYRRLVCGLVLLNRAEYSCERLQLQENNSPSDHVPLPTNITIQFSPFSYFRPGHLWTASSSVGHPPRWRPQRGTPIKRRPRAHLLPIPIKRHRRLPKHSIKSPTAIQTRGCVTPARLHKIPLLPTTTSKHRTEYSDGIQ